MTQLALPGLREGHIGPLPWVRKAEITIPFHWAYSKNSLLKNGRRGRRLGGTFMPPDFVRRIRRDLADQIVAAADGPWPSRRTYLRLVVEKPNNRGDAINFIDVIADAAKRAIAVDDRWFSLLGVDWSVNRDAPHIFIGIYQDGHRPQQACSGCGIIGDSTLFADYESGRTASGLHGRCRECSRRSEKRWAW